jgi:hypothetical protein
MKQLSFLTPALLFVINSFGQLDKQTWLVGGSGSFYTYNENYTSQNLNQTGKWTNIDLSVNVGYFLADKLSCGLRPSFSSYKGMWNGVQGGSNQYHLSVGPFARYYFLKVEKQFNILTDVGYQFGVNKFLGALHQSGKYNIFSAMTGIEAFFNSTAGAEILLGYVRKVVSIDDIPSNAPFTDTKSGFQVSIGFQLYLIK